MWFDYLVIGNGDKKLGAVRVTELGENHNISQNSTSYWISDAYLGVYMTIFKNTKEGIKLQEMIDEKKTVKQINKWLELVVLKHLSVVKLKERIEAEKKRMFNEGERQRASDISRLLGGGERIFVSQGHEL